MATQCCWTITNVLLTTIALGYLHMTYYSTNCIVYLSVFPQTYVTHIYIVLGTRATHITGHIIFGYALCDCMRRFTSSCVVLEVQQHFAIFIGKSSLSSNHVGNSPCAQCIIYVVINTSHKRFVNLHSNSRSIYFQFC